MYRCGWACVKVADKFFVTDILWTSKVFVESTERNRTLQNTLTERDILQYKADSNVDNDGESTNCACMCGIGNQRRPLPLVWQ